MIRVRNLTKRYGRKTAVDDLSFEVEKGEIVGFLGPNGAGKTTTMRILSCYLPPTGGRITVAGHDVLSASMDVRRHVGYLPESVPLYEDMRVVEYLLFRARLKGLRGGEARDSVSRVMDDCGLKDVRRMMISRLSKGFRQRVGLADALVNDPDLLILDEPTIGLDPNQIRLVRGLIKNLAEKHTVLLSSHILPEVEMICERVLIINRGRIVATGRPDELTDVLRTGLEVSVQIGGPRERVERALCSLADVESVSWHANDDGGAFTCSCRAGSDPRAEIFRLVAAEGWSLNELRLERRNLEDVFVALTGTGPACEEEMPEEKAEVAEADVGRMAPPDNEAAAEDGAIPTTDEDAGRLAVDASQAEAGAEPERDAVVRERMP